MISPQQTESKLAYYRPYQLTAEERTASECPICLKSLNSIKKQVLSHGDGGNSHPIHEKCLKIWCSTVAKRPNCQVEVDLSSLFSRRERWLKRLSHIESSFVDYPLQLQELHSQSIFKAIIAAQIINQDLCLFSQNASVAFFFISYLKGVNVFHHLISNGNVIIKNSLTGLLLLSFLGFTGDLSSSVPEELKFYCRAMTISLVAGASLLGVASTITQPSHFKPMILASALGSSAIPSSLTSLCAYGTAKVVSVVGKLGSLKSLFS